MEIKFYNRISKKIEIEKVYGGSLIDWMYKSNSGRLLSNIFSKAPVSIIYGSLQDTSFSKSKIKNFIKNYSINMNDFIPEEGHTEKDPYSTFNKFFIRRFKPGLRSFPNNLNELGAFAEARYFGYESIDSKVTVPVKGKFLNSSGLINNNTWEKVFENGPLLLARLCPVDYHRFHFPDNCKILDDYRIPGLYHSVNPVAIHEKEDIFISNERHVTIMETENFGKLAYIEVGAICVGKIIQTNQLLKTTAFSKGAEKGYFLFGGSTVIVLGEKGRWKPSEDIIENTKNKLETYVQLGMSVATNGK